jgi:hypothetical protein
MSWNTNRRLQADTNSLLFEILLMLHRLPLMSRNSSKAQNMNVVEKESAIPFSGENITVLTANEPIIQRVMSSPLYFIRGLCSPTCMYPPERFQ